MFYRAVNKFTGEAWEDTTFKKVYMAALSSACLDIRDDPTIEFTAIRLFRVEDAIDMEDIKTGDIYTYYIGVKQIGYVQISTKAVYITMYKQGCCTYLKEVL